jgi:hypothetical protein
VSTFTRKQYEQLFQFTLRVYYAAPENSVLELDAIYILRMIEEVLGQQIDMPKELR